MIWQLTFYKDPDAPRPDGFEVGYFATLDDAEAAKAHYTANVPGFRDNPWGSWEIAGHAVDAPESGVIWQACGWNWDCGSNECDLLNSPLFASRDEADACLAEFAARYERDVLEVCRIRVGQRMWAQGFDAE
ncbi:MAG: hypothetical protein IJE07_06470 [Clostridia bacterium]|nr:hypothetical protein [Clostridia bacterium]